MPDAVQIAAHALELFTRETQRGKIHWTEGVERGSLIGYVGTEDRGVSLSIRKAENLPGDLMLLKISAGGLSCPVEISSSEDPRLQPGLEQLMDYINTDTSRRLVNRLTSDLDEIAESLQRVSVDRRR